MKIQKAKHFNGAEVEAVQVVYDTDMNKLAEWSGGTLLKDGTLVLGGQKAKLGDIVVKGKVETKIHTRVTFSNNFYFEGHRSWKEPAAMGGWGK